MTEREEDLDLDRPEVSKALLGEAATPKKKAKGKTRKAKDESEVKGQKGVVTLPLSMLSASSEDTALFEAKVATAKGAQSASKPYNANERYKQGDIMNHKKFGLGYVVAETGLNKVEVVFKTGRKMLVVAPLKTQSLAKISTAEQTRVKK